LTELAVTLKPNGGDLEAKLDDLYGKLRDFYLKMRERGWEIELVAYEDNGARASRDHYESVAKGQRAIQVLRDFFIEREIPLKKVTTSKDIKTEGALLARQFDLKEHTHTPDALAIGYYADFHQKWSSSAREGSSEERRNSATGLDATRQGQDKISIKRRGR